MAQQEKDRLLEHEADGIQEYDNNLPRWWLYGFYFTIVMGALYMFYYHVYTGPDWNVLWYGARTQHAEYEQSMAELELMRANAPKAPKVPMVVMTDAENLAAGKEIFTNNICYTCHREDLGGQVGPNLTDEYWLHGCSLEEIVASIANGYPDKGMLPYGNTVQLDDKQLVQLASYIISMQGTQPEDPKPIEADRDVICGPTVEQVQ